MFKLFVFVVVLAVASARPNYNKFVGRARPTVTVSGGELEGEILSAGLFASYFSFKGIPYAQPPVGNLRFRAPLPHGGWTGVRDAAEHGNICPSSGTLQDKVGDEDCLFLNVYTPDLTPGRAVMVWIHGGSFTGGSGDAFLYGPDHLVQDDVIIVTINYRLGVLGFLSTGDRHAPGNYGMKDMVMALKWVRDNIAAFGGDPNNVTIFGESAGGVAVHYLLLSPMANGLYAKAISQSGSAINPWAFQPDPRSIAYEYAATLGIQAGSTEDLVNQLRNVDPIDFIFATPGWIDLPIPRGLSPMALVPCQDAPDSEEEIFLPGKPIDLMNSGQFNKVPYITGYTNAESLFMVFEERLDPSVKDVINANRHTLIPSDWNIPIGSDDAETVSNEFMNFYLGSNELTAENIHGWTKFMTDHHFGYGIDQTVIIHSRHTTAPLYYYIFSFDGDLNLVKRVLQIQLPGAMHADDVPYLFSISALPPPVLPGNPALETRRRYVRLWTNFAKYSNPTAVHDAQISVDWSPVAGNQEYLNIYDELIPGTHPSADRMGLWNRLREQYARP